MDTRSLVVILKADQLHADLLCGIANSLLPGYDCIRFADASAVRRLLESRSIDLLITGIESTEGDVIRLLTEDVRPPRVLGKRLALTFKRHTYLATRLRALPLNGAFDCGTESRCALERAVRAVAHGGSYWSPALLPQNMRSTTGAQPWLMLTPAEQLVFSTIGDGRDDGLAAAELGLSESTVSSVRREIHRKLNIRHRGELVRAAALAGYVCFSSGETKRPGFSLLNAELTPRVTRRKITAMAPVLVSAG